MGTVSFLGKHTYRNIFLYTVFPKGENALVEGREQFARRAVQALRAQTPVRGLAGVRISDVKVQPAAPFDVEFQLQSGKRRISVFAEIKSTASPRLLEEIAPWILRMKSLRPGVSFVLISPALSTRAQAFAIDKGIDFIDLAGNISINVPGEFTLQRLGMRSQEQNKPSTSPSLPNVFSGRYSRILRVLLEKARPWTLTELSNELKAETDRIAQAFSAQNVRFAISAGAISKALSSLDEQLWIRRQASSVVVPEPRRLLLEWAEKYKERYRWRLRSSFEAANPFGSTPAQIASELSSLIFGPYAFTAAAAATEAPFIDLDLIDVFLLPNKSDAKLRQVGKRPVSETAPRLRFIYPYDEGVFLYSRTESSVPLVSNVQAFLDLYARGGRDLKQADYLLDNVIEKRWKSA